MKNKKKHETIAKKNFARKHKLEERKKFRTKFAVRKGKQTNERRKR